jgi:glycosyltransferase involved in cell wall biosynthesis
LRILQIIPELETGGAELTTVDIAHALVDAGHEAFIISQGGRMVADLPSTATHITLPVASKNPATMLANSGRIAALCRHYDIDLIHARSRAPAWSGLVAAWRTKLPFVTTYHGAYKGSHGPKLWYNSVMARGDAVIANSQFTAGSIAAQFPFARERVVVVHRGTDFSLFDGSAEPYNWQHTCPLPKGARVVVQIARLTDWKGQSVSIGAIAGLPDDVHLVLAGDDQGRTEYRDSLLRLAERAEVSHRVHMVGHVDAARALASADVAIIPSTLPEAFGRAAVEAQAAGVPVVVSKLGAVSETVLAPPLVAEDLRTGWHVKPGDPMALAKGIRAALALEGATRSAHIERARKHVHMHFSLASMCKSTLAIYRRLVS